MAVQPNRSVGSDDLQELFDEHYLTFISQLTAWAGGDQDKARSSIANLYLRWNKRKPKLPINREEWVAYTLGALKRELWKEHNKSTKHKERFTALKEGYDAEDSEDVQQAIQQKMDAEFEKIARKVKLGLDDDDINFLKDWYFGLSRAEQAEKWGITIEDVRAYRWKLSKHLRRLIAKKS